MPKKKKVKKTKKTKKLKQANKAKPSIKVTDKKNNTLIILRLLMPLNFNKSNSSLDINS